MKTETETKDKEILVIDRDYIRVLIDNSKTKEFRVILNKFNINKLKNVIDFFVDEESGKIIITQFKYYKPIQPRESIIFIKNDDDTYDIYGFDDFGVTLSSVELTDNSKLQSKLGFIKDGLIKGYKVSFEFLNKIC